MNNINGNEYEYENNDPNYEYQSDSNNNNNENRLQNRQIIRSIPAVIRQTEENIRFYNEQKKLLKNLYKNLLNKNEMIKNIKKSNEEIKEKLIKEWGAINRGRGKTIYNREKLLKNQDIELLKAEQNKIITSIQEIIRNENLNKIRERNITNTNQLSLKNDNLINRINMLNMILTGSIRRIIDVKIKILSVLKSGLLNTNEYDKSLIASISDLQVIERDINNNNEETGIYVDIHNINSHLNEKYSRSKEYKDLKAKYIEYTTLLNDNKQLFLDTLIEALEKRREYQEHVKELIFRAYEIRFSNNQFINIENYGIIIEELLKILNYRCINLDINDSDTIRSMEEHYRSLM
jgi:hypothetical protein